MFKFIIFCFVVALRGLFATPIAEEIRKEYALKFHEAFIFQSMGATRRAYYCFKTAQQLAQKAGESRHNLQVMKDLFVWYRTYGYAMGVMSKESSCTEEYRPTHKMALSVLPKIRLAQFPDYHSEWGNTPEQAAKIREFMLGVGETISGIFCVTVSCGWGALIGGTLLLDGPRRMVISMNDAWCDYERSCIEFKQWQDRVAAQAGQ